MGAYDYKRGKMMIADFLSTTPDRTVPLDMGGWFINIFLLLVYFSALGAINYFISVKKVAWGLSGFVGMMMLFPIFTIYRTIAPGIGIRWIIYTLILIAVSIGVSAIATQRKNLDNGFIPIGTTAVAVLIAVIFDKLNEMLGSIPMSWGAFILVILIALAVVSDD